MCAAIELDQKRGEVQFEGGEATSPCDADSPSTLTTQRSEGLNTQRAMITDQSKDELNFPESYHEKISREARLRLRLEDQVSVNGRYETIFSGLKLNTAHNSALTEPIAFMIRRTIFAALIVFMPHMPQVATMALLVVCLAIFAMNLAEQPWKDTNDSKLALFNEAVLYVVIVFLLGCASISHVDASENKYLGWVFIFIVCLAIHANLCVILASSYQNAKLVYTRIQNLKKALALKKASAVAPAKPVGKAPLKAPEAIVEVDEEKEESVKMRDVVEPKLLRPLEITVPAHLKQAETESEEGSSTAADGSPKKEHTD